MVGREPLTGRRRLLFAAITLSIPWLLLALLELGLRGGGFGDDYPLFVSYADAPGFRLQNERVGRRYFHGAFVPTVHLDFFRATRSPRTLRLVFQGESSAAGFPYGHGGAPSRMLEQRLQATFPDREVEVVNTAMTAVSSYVLLDQAAEIVALRPDAVLIYTGHNEYYGVFGAASAGPLGRSPALVRAYLALRHLRTVQLVERLVAKGAAASTARTANDEAPSTVMELMAGDQLVPLGSARYARGIAQFRANLDALLARYQAAGIPVFIGTLVSNERDQAPFVTTFAPGTDSVAWRRRYADARAALARGDTTAAEAALTAAIRIDSTAADAQYALGRLRDARGDTARARRAYRAAKESDALRFRAPEAMNAVIREVAARHGATVVESERAVEAASPGGVPGRSLILEHLHPNVDGYFTIADAFYETLRRRGTLGAWAAPIDAAHARPAAPVTAVDSVAAVLRTDRLTAGWPFRARGQHALQMVDTLQPRTPAERLAQALLRGTMSWAEATDRLRAQYEQAGDVDRALHVADVLAGEYHYTAKPYLDAARLALAHDRDDDALRYARAAEARVSTPESAELVGTLLLRRGDQTDAVPFLQRAAERAPDDGRLRGALAGARMLPYLMAERSRAPRDTALLFKLALAYTMTQQPEKARAVLDTLRTIAPQHPGAAALRQRLSP